MRAEVLFIFSLCYTQIPDMQKIKTVFVDWNKTLSFSRFWGHLPDATMRTLFDTYAPQDFKDWMIGKKTTEDMMALAAQGSGLAYEFVLKEFIHSCQNMQLVSLEIPRLVSVLQKNNIQVVIATDNADSFSRWTVPALKLKDMFDNVLNSWDLGMTKNQPYFFTSYLNSNHQQFKDCILIDDSTSLGSIVSPYGMEYRLVTADQDLVYHLTELSRL